MQHDNMHVRTHNMCLDRAWIYVLRVVQAVLKIAKLSHIIGARRSQDLLRSPSPIMAPVSVPCLLDTGKQDGGFTLTLIPMLTGVRSHLK